MWPRAFENAKETPSRGKKNYWRIQTRPNPIASWALLRLSGRLVNEFCAFALEQLGELLQGDGALEGAGGFGHLLIGQ